MLKTIRHFLELIRFSHTLFALPFALLAAVMAWRLQASRRRDSTRPFDYAAFRWQESFGILLCMVTARSFAMAFNRLADRQIDAQNPRTAGRHLPAGILSVPQVTAFAVALRRRLRRQHAAVSAEPPAAVPVDASARCSSPATATPSDSRRWPTSGSARRLPLSPVAAWIAIRGEDVLANPADSAAGARARRRRAHLGRRLRHHLRLPGLRRRSSQPDCTAFRRGSAFRRTATGRRLPPASRSSCSPACRWCIRSSAGSTGLASRPSRCCWSTSICSCGRTTFPA